MNKKNLPFTPPQSSVLATQRKQSLQFKDRLLILTYNIFMRPASRFKIPIFRDRQLPRATPVGNFINNGEVVILNEMFDTSSKKVLLDTVNFPFIYEPPVEDGVFYTSSGLMVLSQWNIIKSDFDYFKDYCWCDGMAYKGIAYVAIDKGGKEYHIFATHLQSGLTEKDASVRYRQLVQMKIFIDKQTIPKSDPVLFVGDFNIDRLSSEKEYNLMLKTLSSEDTTQNPETITYDTNTNSFLEHNLNSPQQLDYIMFSTQYSPCHTLSSSVLKPSERIGNHVTDLSDHYAVSVLIES